jgi:hypothetical protein
MIVVEREVSSDHLAAEMFHGWSSSVRRFRPRDLNFEQCG